MKTKAPSKPKHPVEPVNPYQAALCATFAHGDYAQLAESKNWRRDLKACDDALFKFLMVELSTTEGCDDDEEAIRRLQSVSNDVLAVVGAIEALPMEPADTITYANPYAVPLARHKATIMAGLKLHGVKAVEVRYHGKFDITELRSIKAYDNNGLIVSLQTSTVTLDPGRLPMLLGDAISDFTWDLLRVHVPAFMKAEGGNGKLRFRVDDNYVSLKHQDYRPGKLKRFSIDV